MTLDILNITSSVLGLIGTCLIFKFGIPSRIDLGGYDIMVPEQPNKAEIKVIARDKFFGKTGLLLVSLSFFFQLLIGFGLELKVPI